MFSLRSVLPRRAHKERAQLQSRKKFGLLEKHKDYVVRARAYQKKETLRESGEQMDSRKTRADEDPRCRKIEKLTAVLHSLDKHPSNRHIYYAEDREEAKEMQLQSSEGRHLSASEDVPCHIKKKIACSYGELEARRNRVIELEKLHMDMSLQKELQKRVGSANFAKMRLSVQPLSQCASGSQIERGGKVYVDGIS